MVLRGFVQQETKPQVRNSVHHGLERIRLAIMDALQAVQSRLQAGFVPRRRPVSKHRLQAVEHSPSDSWFCKCLKGDSTVRVVARHGLQQANLRILEDRKSTRLNSSH